MVHERSQGSDHHHHAPAPVEVQGELAQGILEIIDTRDGERMRFSANAPLSNTSVTVTINRDKGAVETLVLMPEPGSATVFISDRPPDEPHEFSAQLRLQSSNRHEVLPFQVYEPSDHNQAHSHAHGDRGHGSHGHSHNSHGHSHGRGHGSHGHTHGIIDASIPTSERGLWAIKWSFIGLAVTAMFQIVVVLLSGSVGLLADTIHNFGDAATAVPLGIAFLFARKRPTKQFPFGYGRVEDLAGVTVVLLILFSAIVAGYQSIQRFIHPQPVGYLWAVIAASLVGFVGNEAVAIFRIRVGKEIGSAALIADGYHARIDGWTSLAVLFGGIGIWLGYPIADPLVGLGITVAIFGIVWDSAKAVFTHLLDGVEPEVIDGIKHTASEVQGVREVTEVRARWIGHRLNTEINIAVAANLSVAEAHVITTEVHHQLLHHLRYLSLVTIHVDPPEASGEDYHRIAAHSHDGLPIHSHG
jgi:cation diffusion facilitator family transporter